MHTTLTSQSRKEKDPFTDAYVALLTDSFADELDEVRKNAGSQGDVNLLIDFLANGISKSYFTQEDKLMLMQKHFN